MSQTIDKRIVEMEFDNKQFETNVKTSMSTLEKLKQSLKFDGAAKGLENVSKAADKCNLSGLSSAVETVQAKFSGFQVMAVTALANIANSAVNAGKRMISALTIDPIKTGFSEYETKINSIQTIMSNTASKGTTMEDVTRVIDELNTYADKTIYNFAEMTRNIGTFTAAGIGLEDSAKAIQGIANLAAASGSSSQQASTAMYQLSQALATGTVKLMDWNSVVNAGMGGEKFQEALKATAREHGVAVDQIIKKNGSFRDSLQEGWLSADILNETLNKFTVDGAAKYAKSMMDSGKWTQEQADALISEAQAMEDAATKVKTFTQLWDTLKESAQSGWSQSWEIIVGNFDEAKDLLTQISDTLGGFINASADARNKVLQDWKDLGGRTAIIEAIKNAFEGLISILNPIKQAFEEIFPAITGQQLADFSNKLKQLTENFKISESTASKIKETFKGLFSAIKIGVQIITSFISAVGKVVGKLLPVGNSILDITSALGSFVTKIGESIDRTKIFQKVFNGLSTVLGFVATGISKAINTITGGFKHLNGVDFNLFDKLSGIADMVSKAFNKIREVLGNAMQSLGFDNLLDVVNGGLLAGIMVGIKKFVNYLSDLGPLSSISEILDSVKSSLEAWQSSIKANTLLKIGAAIGVLAASIVVLSTINPARLASSLGAMTGLFAELFGSMVVFEKIMGGKGIKSTSKVATAMIGLSVAVLILSTAMKNLGELDWNQLAKGLTSIAVLIGELVAVSIILDKNSTKMVKGSAGLILFSTSILILANAVKDLGGNSWGEITKGLVSVGALLAELALFMNMTDFDGMGLLNGAGILLLATSIKVLSGAVSSFAALDTGSLVKGLAAVGAVLAELAIFTNVTGNANKVLSTAVSMTILSASMLILANAVKSFSSMSWGEIAKGLVSMAGALAIITAAMYALPKDMLVTSASLLIVSSSLVILAKAIGSMGSMSWEEIAKGLVTLAGSLLVIAAAMYAMTGALPGAAALLIVSAALLALTPVLIALGSMSLSEIGMSLLALAGAFTVIGIAGLVLGPISPIIMALAAAIALLGVGVLAAGAGVLAFSAGITALGIAFTVSGAAIIAAITSLLNLIPLLATKIGEGIVAMVAAIGNGAVSITTAVAQILTSILQAITDVVPKLMETISIILVGVLNVIIEVSPKIVETVISVLSNVLNGIVEFVPKMVDAGMKIITGYLQGIADNIGGVVESAVNIVTEFLNALGTELPRIVDAGFNMMINFINGLADSINTNTPILTAAIGNLMKAVINAAITLITGSIGNFLSAGASVFGGFISGLSSKVSGILSTISSAISQAVNSITSRVSEFVAAGGNIISGFISGIKSKISEVASAAANMAKSALNSAKNALGIHSPSRAFMSIGKYIGEGLARGIRDSAWQAVYWTEDTAKRVLDVASRSFEDIEKWIEESKYFNELSLAEELEIWEAVIARYAEGTEERLKADKNAYSVYKELQKENFENSKNWIEQEKYYNRMSLEEELAAWERVQARYIEGTDERKEADREVYRLKNELMDASYQNSMNWIEQEKYYNRMSLADELAAYTRVQKRYAKGAEERKKMDKEVYRVQKEINDARKKYYDDIEQVQEESDEKRLQLEQEYADKTKEINEKLQQDIKALNDEYINAVDSRAQSLYNSYGLFDEVAKKEAVSSDTLMQNLKDQVHEFQDWESVLDQLSARGLNSALIDELQEMGPSAIAEIKALNSMTDSQLAQYATLWSTKHKEAKERATSELEDMRIETQSQIANLRMESAKELDEYREMWNKQMNDLNKETTAKIEQLTTDFNKQVGIMKTNTEEELKEMTTNAQEIMRQAGWNELGEQIVDGIGGGIEKKKPSLLDAIAGVATAAVGAVKKVLDIHSPSRVFSKIGMYMDEGMIQGLNRYSGQVSEASESVGHDAIGSISKVIKGITNLLDSDMDVTPTIRPVLDMTDISNGLGYMDGAFAAKRSMSLGVNISQNQNGDKFRIDEFTEKLASANNQSGSKIVDTIEGLRADMSNLLDRFSQLQVVMDTGTLVGAIAPDMDNALGGLANMNRRGVR